MEPSDESTLFWLALTRVEGLGVRGAHQLVQHFASPQAAYMASLTELEACGLPARVAQALFAQAGQAEAGKEKEAAEKAGVRLLSFSAKEYPPLLKQIPDPPLVLYVRGNVQAWRNMPWRSSALASRRLTVNRWRTAWPATSRSGVWR